MTRDITDNKSTGNGLVPSGSKPLREPMLIQFYVAHIESLATANQ